MALDYKKIALYSQITYTFPLIVFAGAFAGWFLDRKAGTGPLFLVFGFLAGMAGGFWNVFRLLGSEKDGD